jgi:hypothetical protein
VSVAAPALPLTSRAVILRANKVRVPLQRCPGCGSNKWNTGSNLSQNTTTERYIVVCNIYRRGRWVGVRHYHPACYQSVGMPCGEPVDRRAANQTIVPKAKRKRG